MECAQIEKSTRPLISVIVPVYNRKATLHRCIDSILAQTYQNLEIILVDDGATDGSDEICDQYADIDSRVKVIHKANGGVSSARNAGLNVAHGEYIGFVDSDDTISESMYELLFDTITKTGADISGCRRHVHHGGHACPIATTGDIFQYSVKQYIYECILAQDNKVAWTVWDKLFKSDIVASCRFDEYLRICEDVDFLLRIFKNSLNISVIDEAGYHYYVYSNSLSRAYTLKYMQDREIVEEEFEEFIYRIFDENELQVLIGKIARDYIKILILFYTYMRKDADSTPVYERIMSKLKMLSKTGGGQYRNSKQNFHLSRATRAVCL
jgi:glycosyltransferase involved in cell wall biosynthesis